ncbi:MAG: 50S ribosomal protein L3 [Ectothiorhodospiraceae bacterium]|nr:50S ribosomal protein L3 [Ectothiorhodospiraceae bacterium]
MTLCVVGRKLGMTRVFTEAGASVPVTVIQVEPARVVAKRTEDREGYSAVQVTVGEVKASNVTKPLAGHFSKAGVEAGRLLKEFRLTADEVESYELGASIGLDLFEEGQKVDVTGTTIGKGFAGAVKRHNFRTQDATHGNSLSHRAPGSIGQNQTPGRVFKGKKMAGHMGNKQRTIQNLEVVRVDADRSVLLIKGAVPGSKGSDVIVKPAVKGKK